MAIAFEQELSLRGYQDNAVTAILDAISKKKNHPLVVLPTSMGKTYIAAEAYLRLRDKGLDGQLLWIANTGELLDQAKESFAKANPKLRLGIEKADSKAHQEDDVVFATIQTLKGERMEKYLANNKIGMVTCDEAHHSAAVTYRELFETFKTKNEKGIVLGLTATPDRADGKEIRDFFDVVYEMGLEEAINQAWQPNIYLWRVDTHSDLGDVEVRGNRGDYESTSLSKAVNTLNRNAGVVSSYFHLQNHIQRSPHSIAFAADVRHAMDLCKAFKDEGVAADVIHGEMDKKERARIVDSFRAGKIRLLTNVNCASEGFDIPTLDSVFLARPSRSKILITQQMGRSTRLHPEISQVISKCTTTEQRSRLISESKKPAVHIVDFSDNCERLVEVRKPISASELLGIPYTMIGPKRPVPVKEITKQIQKAVKLGANVKTARDLKDVQVSIRVSEISNKSQKNTSIFDKMTSLVAIKLADNTILLSVPTPEKKYYRMQRNISNTWRIIYGVGEEPTTQVGGPSKTFTDLASSFLFLEKHLQHENIAHYRMLSKNAPWRNKPASYDQQKFLYFYNETEKLTSGEASDRINYHKQPKLIQPKITKQEPIKTVLAITDQQYYRLKNYLKLGKEDLPENRLEAWNEMQQIVREQNRKRYGR